MYLHAPSWCMYACFRQANPHVYEIKNNSGMRLYASDMSHNQGEI